MHPIEAQQEVITQLCQIIQAAAAEGCSEASCRFDYATFDDGSSSVSSRFKYFLDGECVSASPGSMREYSRASDLVRELHRSMKAHTGGDWTGFTLTLDQDGRATAKFDHPQETP